MSTASALQLKDSRTPDRIPDIVIRDEGDEKVFQGVRCPRCAWRPQASSIWCCSCVGTPEPPFDGCLTLWNTFMTRGRCPGCGHQWQWTSCPQCAESSLHVDWYESEDRPS